MSLASAMSDLIRLVLALAGSGGERQGHPQTARIVIVTVAAAICAVAAAASGVTAVWIFALPHVGPAGAPAIVAGILLAFCFALLALRRYGLKRRAPPPGANTSVLFAEATRLLQDHKGAVLTAALVAGLIAGRGEK